jgi:hypothetical protein
MSIKVSQNKFFMVKKAKHFATCEFFCANEVETIGVFSFFD